MTDASETPLSTPSSFNSLLVRSNRDSLGGSGFIYLFSILDLDLELFFDLFLDKNERSVEASKVLGSDSILSLCTFGDELDLSRWA